jgi:hypothetical protein
MAQPIRGAVALDPLISHVISKQHKRPFATVSACAAGKAVPHGTDRSARLICRTHDLDKALAEQCVRLGSVLGVPETIIGIHSELNLSRIPAAAERFVEALDPCGGRSAWVGIGAEGYQHSVPRLLVRRSRPFQNRGPELIIPAGGSTRRRRAGRGVRVRAGAPELSSSAAGVLREDPQVHPYTKTETIHTSE